MHPGRAAACQVCRHNILQTRGDAADINKLLYFEGDVEKTSSTFRRRCGGKKSSHTTSSSQMKEMRQISAPLCCWKQVINYNPELTKHEPGLGHRRSWPQPAVGTCSYGQGLCLGNSLKEAGRPQCTLQNLRPPRWVILLT